MAEAVTTVWVEMPPATNTGGAEGSEETTTCAVQTAVSTGGSPTGEGAESGTAESPC